MGDSGIAIGNAVGSAIANIGMVVATVALITRVTVAPDAFNSRARWMLVATVLSWSLVMSRMAGLILVMLRKHGTLAAREGSILLGAFVLYLCGLAVIPLLD